MAFPKPNPARILFLVALSMQLSLAGFSQILNPGMQEDTSGGERIGKLKIEGYLDLYGNYHSREKLPGFVNHAEPNQININLAFIDLRYQTENVRSRITPAIGTYMQANYGSIGHLYEATAGFRIYRNIWVDAGILPAPFSNESPISKDHLMYTRSLSAEFVPYYMTGARLSIPVRPNLKWYFYVVNNWQSIGDNNRLKSFTSQWEYRPNASNLLNWNVYYGNDGYSSWGNLRDNHRWLSDLYWVYQPEGRFGFTTCLWAMFQKPEDPYSIDYRNRIANRYFSWQANFIARYRIRKKHSISGRVEYYQNGNYLKMDQLYLASVGSLASTGLCWNVEVAKNALFRVEGRQFLVLEKVEGETNTFSPSDFGTWIILGATVSY